MSSPCVSVILTTYNRADLLPVALQCLSAQTFPREKWELVIMDDGSTDATPQIIAPFLRKMRNARYFKKKHEGLSAGRNGGISHAKWDLVAFTDYDCLPSPDWISELWATYQKEKPLGIEGKVITDTNKPLFSNAPQNERGRKYIGCNSAYTRAILDKVGGYDKRFFWVRDDTDVAFRVLKHGKIAFAEKAVVYHPARATNPVHLVKRLSIIQSDLLLFRKHPREYWKNFGFPNRNNWIRSLFTYALLFFLFQTQNSGMIIGGVVLFLALESVGYAFFRSALFSMKTIEVAAIFSFTLLVRDLIFPLAFVYYAIKTAREKVK